MIETLTQTESNEVTRDLKQIAYCELPDNVIIINGFPPFKRNIAALKVEVEYIDGKEIFKDVSGVGTTTGKMSLKVGFADYESRIINLVHAFALDPENRTPETIVDMEQLAHDMSIRQDQIISMKDDEIFSFAGSIKAKIMPYLTQLNAQDYAIIEADLDEGISKATLFKNSIGAASTIEQGAHVAGVDIHKSYVKILAVQKMIKLNLSHWNFSNSDFVEGMKASSVIDHLGHSNTILRGGITGGPDNVLLPDATVQNLRNERFADVNILAQYEMRKFHAHLDNWAIECDGYVRKVQPIKTEAGKAVIVNFHLDPIVPAP